MITIYALTDLITGKKYIGQTNNLASRKRGHRYSRKFKYFYIETLWTINDKTLADCWERYFINYFRTDDSAFGYNHTSGGKRGYSISNIYRNNLRVSHTGIKQSVETRQKRSRSLMGHKINEYTKRRIYESSIGRKMSETLREKFLKCREKKVIDVKQGTEFDSGKKCWEQNLDRINCSYTHFSAMLAGTKKNKTNFIYVK